MHMVKAILPQLQLEAEPMTRLSRQLTGVVGKVRRVPNRLSPASHPEQPQMNGGKGRKENLNASHLCLSKNAGLPKQGIRKPETLQGNRVTVVPNVHAVMAWAARTIVAANER